MTTTNTQLSAQDEKKIEEVMGLVSRHGLEYAAHWAPQEDADALYAAIESKLRELVPVWLPIESAPKDGSEFIAVYANQGFVKTLAKWNALHGYWENQGRWLPGFESNATHWKHY